MEGRRKQSRKEEFFNGLSHLLGLGILVGWMFPLYDAAARYQEGRFLWTLIPFFIGIVSTYSASSIYHFTKTERRKDRWRIVDHMSIFFLIGGTYTPVIMQYTHRPVPLIFLGIMWTIIFAGIILKLWWTGKYNNLSTGLYVSLGWMLVFVIWPLWKNAPAPIFGYLLAGGFAYTIGVFFYKKSDIPYFHVVWHLFVFLGTCMHMTAIYMSFSGL